MVAKRNRKLRSGYTTGACAAAAAKAAVELLVKQGQRDTVEIPFPNGSRVSFALCRSGCQEAGGVNYALASVVKDAGDDPDVTNGAEIVARASLVKEEAGRADNCVALAGGRIFLCGGEGVGRVTKPGLAVSPGELAINPVPRQMIVAAVREAMNTEDHPPVEIVISVPGGEELAAKTLNYRLGIVGGLSILGTTGIVRPVSAAAWTATIEASMDVARAAGLSEIVLSTGRTSERAVQRRLDLPEEAFAMMGDYLEFSLRAAAKKNFRKIHLAGMWAKVLKAAMEIPQTHVRHGALETEQALEFLASLGSEPSLLKRLEGVNTAREIYERLAALGETELIRAVCVRAGEYGRQVSDLEVRVYLVHSSGKVVASV
jgi:cobalt-precorrin-5B (C1)-methyltransferase